jgi:hypothetical protein
MSTEGLDHAGQVLARKNGVVHYQIADRLPVFAAFYWRKLLHNDLLLLTFVPCGAIAG